MVNRIPYLALLNKDGISGLLFSATAVEYKKATCLEDGDIGRDWRLLFCRPGANIPSMIALYFRYSVFPTANDDTA